MDKLAFIIPTGIGASIGGYAGDAGAYARKLSEKYTLIVNPNAVNAACFSAINDNMLYVEGFAMDLFFKEQIALRSTKANKIGVIFDKAIPEGILNVHLNTLDAMRMVYGIETVYEITKNPVGVEFLEAKSGISTGNVENINTLYESAQNLINQGCNALAPVCLFKESEDDEAYANSQGIDIVGGVEAVISHLLTQKFLLPCAHAPAFKSIDIPQKRINPKSAAEYITPTFLPCIILGLFNAPQLIKFKDKMPTDICAKDLSGIAMPFNSLGSTPVFKGIELGIPIYAIKENSTILNVTKDALRIKKITEIEKYSEL